MTLRAKPVTRRRGRAGWDSGDRRNSLINAGFFLAIGISALILVGYGIWSWYDDHFGAAATVDGSVITKDDLRNRLAIESFRLNYIESRIQTLLASGKLSSSDASQQIDLINQRRNQLASLTLDRLVDVQLQGKLAADRGISVSDGEIDQQLVDEATTAELRHVWMIEVEPVPNPDTGDVGDTEKRTALGNAQRALARLKNGESWDDVAKTVDTSGLAPQAGDLGWINKDSGYDEDFMAAVFAAEPNQPTAVIAGTDDVYRIGRYTESAPEQVDPSFQAQVEDAGIKLADYRAAARGDVLRHKLSDDVVAELSKPGKQRHVLEIYLPEPNASAVGTEPGVKVRWIVYAPNDSTADAPDLNDDDPAWAAAKADGDAAYAELKDHLDRFDATARAESDEQSAKQSGGKQPWIYATTSIDQPVKNAVLTSGLKGGELLAPVKGELGWYVIQFLRPEGDGDKAWLEDVATKITDDASFKQAARDNSEGDKAGEGGDIGWIATGQLTDQLDDAIFKTDVGKDSEVISIESDGTYLLRVLAEETREPTDEQLQIFKNSGFAYWYSRQKDAADIKYATGSSSSTG